MLNAKSTHTPEDNVRFATFHDAGWAARPDGCSQGGYIVMACDKPLLERRDSPVSMIDWKSWELKR
eukprot:6819151-Lingulodinium_polyedra.AAC.1